MMIIIFIIVLTRVNDQPQPELYPESIPESGFKNIVIIIFIITLTQVNPN